MFEVRALPKVFSRGWWFLIGGVAILALTAFTRAWELDRAKRYVFDEVYHVVTARLMAENDPRAFEWWHPPPEPNTAIDWLHPPLAKYTQAVFINVLGDNEWGWRASSVTFGVLTVLATMLLTHSLFRSRVATLAAGVFALSDGLLLVMSRITMNDIHVTTFLIFGFWAYWERLHAKSAQQRKWWVASVLFMGLAMGSKWSGLFGFGVIIGLEFLNILWRKSQHTFKVRQLGWWVAGIAAGPILYLASYTQMFLQGKGWAHLKELHEQIWAYQTTLTATHPYQSRPLEWFLNVRPVWMFVKYDDGAIANIYAFANPIFSVLVWVAVGYVLTISLWGWWSVWKYGWKSLATPIRAWLSPFTYASIIFFAVWLPWIVSPRIMFFYHYTPAIPLACVLVAGVWTQLWREFPLRGVFHWAVLPIPLLLCLAVFVLWYPHWTGMPVTPEFANQVYFLLPSWK
jgi:dolichyl-phosphate-mannose-protein mannosyltransferase